MKSKIPTLIFNLEEVSKTQVFQRTNNPLVCLYSSVICSMFSTMPVSDTHWMLKFSFRYVASIRRLTSKESISVCWRKWKKKKTSIQNQNCTILIIFTVVYQNNWHWFLPSDPVWDKSPLLKHSAFFLVQARMLLPWRRTPLCMRTVHFLNKNILNV